MSKRKAPDVVITLRIPTQLVERIDATRAQVSGEREFILKSKITRSDLVRYLLLVGLERIEEAHEVD